MEPLKNARVHCNNRRERNMTDRKKLTFYALFRDSGWWVVGEIMKKALAHDGYEVEISWNTRERRLTEVANGHIDFGIIEEWVYLFTPGQSDTIALMDT
jgi:hypothetical protein